MQLRNNSCSARHIEVPWQLGPALPFLEAGRACTALFYTAVEAETWKLGCLKLQPEVSQQTWYMNEFCEHWRKAEHQITQVWAVNNTNKSQVDFCVEKNCGQSALILWKCEIIFRCWEGSSAPVAVFPQYWIAIIAHKARKALGGVSRLIVQDKKLDDTNTSGERTELCAALVAAVCDRNWNEQWGKREIRGLPKGDVYSCTLTSR